ncbi:hypothetical protein [Natronorubrum texcoconense]|uniref:Uncharacterized protein n=1 Tax=Natronorubrum texcoconense TaxID=1095776 RepID=A0A1G8VPT4_9EURY|nr:hypothetical protein [Natronorubrum texcoconense]SDJ67954.1 hypothetical protein SAMN04515672_1442 [Natronorubrum texcoconense]
MTDALESQLRSLTERVERLETELERKDERIATLESKLDEHDARLEQANTQLKNYTDRLEDHTDRLEEHTNQIEDHAERIDALETRTTTTTRQTEAALKKANANKTRLRELQSRELEKGAHLRAKTVDEHEVDVPDGRLERITKDDGRAYFRLPDTADPLDGTNTTLAYGDLLPIQQLARMDEDMLRSTTNALPTRLAAKLWKARTDSSVGDDPWRTGCKGITASLKASDLKHWIRRQEPGTSEAYAKKLVSRTIDAALELSKNRLAVRKRTERKNGLEYTERRLIVPDDAELPGETTDRPPETADVLG